MTDPRPDVPRPRDVTLEDLEAHVRRTLRAPGIGLALVGLFGFAMIALGFAMKADPDRAWSLIRGENASAAPADAEEAEARAAFEDALRYVRPIPLALSLLTCALTLLGAYALLTAGSLALARLGAVAAFLPFLSPCCFPLGLIFGIWGLMALMREEVAIYFRERALIEARGRRAG